MRSLWLQDRGKIAGGTVKRTLPSCPPHFRKGHEQAWEQLSNDRAFTKVILALVISSRNYDGMAGLSLSIEPRYRK